MILGSQCEHFCTPDVPSAGDAVPSPLLLLHLRRAILNSANPDHIKISLQVRKFYWGSRFVTC